MRVLAGDRQQPLGDHRLVRLAADAGVGNDRQRLPDQRCQPEVRLQPGQRRRDHAVAPEHRGEDAPDGALAAPARPHDHEDLLLRGVRRQRVAEPVLQRVVSLAVVAEQLAEECQPVHRLSRVGIERHVRRGEAEIARRRRIKLAAGQMQQPVGDREHLGGGRMVVGVVQPSGRLDRAVEMADRSQGVHDARDDRATRLERHRFLVDDAPRAFHEDPRRRADRLVGCERIMIRLRQPERAAMVMQQPMPVAESRRDQRARGRHRIARIQQDNITVLADSRQRCPRVTRIATAFDGLDEVFDLLLRHHRNLLHRVSRASTSAGFHAGAMRGRNFCTRAATSRICSSLSSPRRR